MPTTAPKRVMPFTVVAAGGGTIDPRTLSWSTYWLDDTGGDTTGLYKTGPGAEIVVAGAEGDANADKIDVIKDYVDDSTARYDVGSVGNRPWWGGSLVGIAFGNDLVNPVSSDVAVIGTQTTTSHGAFEGFFVIENNASNTGTNVLIDYSRQPSAGVGIDFLVRHDFTAGNIEFVYGATSGSGNEVSLAHTWGTGLIVLHVRAELAAGPTYNITMSIDGGAEATPVNVNPQANNFSYALGSTTGGASTWGELTRPAFLNGMFWRTGSSAALTADQRSGIIAWLLANRT